MQEVLKPVKDELMAADALVRRAFLLDGYDPSPLLQLDADSSGDFYIRPALVLLTSRLFHHCPPKAVAMACVHQFIHLAAHVHGKVGEDVRPGQRGYQFPVLVGDYLYGKFFSTLCGAGINGFLADLALVICDINNGGMMRTKNTSQEEPSHDPLEVIRLETAELYASCCRLGGAVSGAPESERKKLHMLGIELGMAFGCAREGYSPQEVSAYLHRALDALGAISTGKPPDTLERLIRLLLERDISSRRIAG